MNALLRIDMMEATRLTREGKLKEATALLRGNAGAAASADGGNGSAVEPNLDMAPPTASDGAWTLPLLNESKLRWENPVPSQTSHVLRKIFGRLEKHRSLPSFDGFAGEAERGPPALPDGARFLSRAYADSAGSRNYKLYVPSTYSSIPVPLVVMLHGCTQSPDDFAAGTRMNEVSEEWKFLVAYPAQSQAANAAKCWNWFNAGDQVRDRGEPSLIAGITREIMCDFEVEASKVFVAGLSAGGAAAAVMGSTYPDLYAAIGVHSGLACGAARDMQSAFAAMKQGGGFSARGGSGLPRVSRTIVFHGDRDATVNPINSDEIIAQSKAADLRMSVTQGSASGGIRYTRSVHSDSNNHAKLEQWILHGAGHAWSGGSRAGSYTEPRGPDASREMIRFFLDQ